MGHPNVHVLNQDVNWTTDSDNPFIMAILKVKVVPPRTDDLPPILPFKLDNDPRLLFSHCRTCAKRFKEGAVIKNYSCKHTDEERSFVCTATGFELNLALLHGWKVVKVYRALDYERTDENLFKNYIREFMRLKIHASGFDASVRGDWRAEEKFIQENKQQFGIDIDRAKMIPNKGKRSLAKLMLNNLCLYFSY